MKLPIYVRFALIVNVIDVLGEFPVACPRDLLEAGLFLEVVYARDLA